MEPSFEFFDHTADMGLRVRAPTFEKLIETAADALYAAIGELKLTDDVEPFELDLPGRNRAELLRDYLDRLLFLFERHRRVLKNPSVGEFSENRLLLHGQAILVDDDRSIYHHEVKAITYHALNIRPVPGGFEAEVIVDI